MIRRLSPILAAALLWSMPASAEFVDDFRSHLETGRIGDAVAAAEARLAEAPGDDQARFALGAAQFLGAVEGLGQGFHRHGLRSSYQGAGGMLGLPFLRLPVPDNPAPEEATYDAIRAVLVRFVDDLARAEATLAGIEAETVDLPLNVGLIRLDLDGNGTGSDAEALWRIFAVVAGGGWLDAEAAARLDVDFDASDVPWLRAYCHFLSALAEIPLAHDLEETFEVTFPGIFHMPGSPNARLGTAATEAAAALAELDQAEASEDEEEEARGNALKRGLRNRLQYGGAADAIAFIHLNHWDVVEPERMARAHAHLLAMVDLGRENWRRILSETDDGAEWIPNPDQTGVLPEMAVEQDIIDGWLLFLDEFEALLKGDKLLPHWRFDEGINLARVFLEPRTFDLILMIQGAGAIPHLEDGEMTDDATWRRIMTLMRGEFFRYAVWFN